MKDKIKEILMESALQMTGVSLDGDTFETYLADEEEINLPKIDEVAQKIEDELTPDDLGLAVFRLANSLAIKGFGKESAKLHKISNKMRKN